MKRRGKKKEKKEQFSHVHGVNYLGWTWNQTAACFSRDPINLSHLWESWLYLRKCIGRWIGEWMGKKVFGQLDMDMNKVGCRWIERKYKGQAPELTIEIMR